MLINNHQLYVESHGIKTDHPLIFLHHGLGSTRSWRRQISFFVDLGYQVLLYDRWGYGKSESRPYLAVPSFKDDLADLKILIETLDLQPATLIGHSDGGSIALYFAIQNPDYVNALVSVAAHIYLEPKMELGILGIKNSFDSDSQLRKGLKGAHGEKFETTFNNWFYGWKVPEALDWDMRPILSGVLCPALVVQGIDDEHATPQHAIDIADGIPDANLWLVPGVKHMLPQDIPDEFNQRLKEFLISTMSIQSNSIC
jgi:pimeloyl-ACP methyl ester carboxylesterase